MHIPSLTATSLLRQVGVYMGSNVISRAIPFLLLPILTRHLSPSDFGLVAMFMLAAVVLEPIVTLGLQGAIAVTFFDRAVDLPRYIGTAVIVMAGIAVPIALLVIVLSAPLTEITKVPAAWLVLTVPLVFARGVGGALLTLLRLREKVILFAVSQNLHTAALMGMAVGLIVFFGADWRGRIVAELLAWGLLAMAAVIALERGRWVRRAFVFAYAGDLARFGLPLIPHTLGAAVMVQTDRLLLTNLVGLSETGLYSVGFQLASVVELVAVSFNSAYAPWLFRRLPDADDRARSELVTYTYVHFAGMAAFAGVVAVGMPWIAKAVLGSHFEASSAYIPWFSLGFLFTSWYYMVTNYIFFTRRTGWLAAVTIVTALFNIPLTYVLITINGGVGAAQSTAIALGIGFVLTWIVSHRVYPMPWLNYRGRP
jgi:O-antigen/teichoic acid export membrane protein